MTLIEFLSARLDEDERAARRVDLARLGSPLHLVPQDSELRPDVHDYEVCADPARVLAELAGKRVIIEQAAEASALDLSVDSDRRVGTRDEANEPYCGDVILRALAQPYADHPDFDPAWRA